VGQNFYKFLLHPSFIHSTMTTTRPKAAVSLAKKTPAKKVVPKVVPKSPQVFKLAKAADTTPATVLQAAPAALRLFQVNAAPAVQVDTAFEAYALPTTASPLQLIDGMRQLSGDPVVQASALWGMMPHDFTQRTGLTGDALREAITARPGYDLYFCHAHPELEATYHNPWLQAEVSHPNFMLLAAAFLKAADLPEAPLYMLTHSALFATGHLLVASPAFWTAYMAFIDHTLSQAQATLGKTARIALFEEQPQPGQFSYLYLIVARLIGFVIGSKNQTWRVCKLPLPPETSLNPHLRLLRELKDTAIVQQSRWLTACWGNYRALYLAHTLGKTWLSTHLAAVSPKTLQMGQPPVGIDYAYPPTMAGQYP
jgi:hypothetical protein